MVSLIEVPIEPIPDNKCQRETSKSDLIDSEKSYLVKIYSFWYAGRFSKQWYGWSFDNWGTTGIQLDSISGPIFEIVE